MVPTHLLPRAVRARFEFSPGFALPELGAVLAGGACGFLLQLGWLALRVPGPAGFAGRIFLFALPLCAGFLLMHQDAAGGSLFGQLRAARSYWSRPHRYLYRYRGWAP